ncbi:hypothetical protein P041_01138, partial [Brucella sp. 04-5288]
MSGDFGNGPREAQCAMSAGPFSLPGVTRGLCLETHYPMWSGLQIQVRRQTCPSEHWASLETGIAH